MGAMPSCVAPPAASNAAVAFPCWILLTRALFAPREFGTGPAAPAALASSASAAAAVIRFRNEIITLPLFLPLETTRERSAAFDRGPVPHHQESATFRVAVRYFADPRRPVPRRFGAYGMTELVPVPSSDGACTHSTSTVRVNLLPAENRCV